MSRGTVLCRIGWIESLQCGVYLADSTARATALSSLRSSPRATARSMMPHVWSHLVPRMLIAPLTVCVASSTSIAKRSKRKVEPASLEGPRRADLFDSMSRTVHPRRPSLEDRAKLTTVEMSPLSLGCVVVTRKRFDRVTHSGYWNRVPPGCSAVTSTRRGATSS